MDYSPKKIYFLVGSLVLVILVLVLAVFLTRDGFQTEKGKIITVSACPKQLSYQGFTYQTEEIGEQCWMVENLRVFSYRDGSAVSNLPLSADWAEDKEGAYTCYYNEERYCDDYGALYNWYAVNNEKKLCPEGWNVPTHEQWVSLERTVCQDLGHQDCQEQFPQEFVSGWRGTDEGWNLRSADLEGSDKYGFKALFGGTRNSAGPFMLLGENGFWWVASDDEDAGYGRAMTTDDERVRWIASSKPSGFSVRCIKD